jgi:hypothetical protein
MSQERTFPIRQKLTVTSIIGVCLIAFGVAFIVIGLSIVFSGGSFTWLISGCVFLAVGTLLSRKKSSSGQFTIGPNGIRVQDKTPFDFQWSQVRRVTLGKGPRVSASRALRMQGEVGSPTNIASAQAALFLAGKAEDSWWFDFEVEPQGVTYLIHGAFFAKSQHREAKHWIRKAVHDNLRPEQIVKS